MIYLSGAITLSVLISFVILQKILSISHKKKLYDLPDERKIHKYPIPRLGGLSFFPVIFIVMQCYLLSSSLLQNIYSPWGNDGISAQCCSFSIGVVALYLIGVKDDLVGVDYKAKFLVQIISGLLLVMSGLWLSSFGGFSLLKSIPAFIGMPLSVFLCVYIINGINLIDGVDGLASGLSIISLFTMGLLFIVGGENLYAILAFSAVGCLIPFFWINVRKSKDGKKKLFMGDTGSLTIGYLITFLFFSLCENTASFTPLENRFHYIAFGTLIIPLFDVTRVVLLRLRIRKPPFAPDRNHIHHKLLRTGMTDTQVMLFLLTLSVFFILCNYILTAYLYGIIVVVIDVFIWLLFHVILDLFIQRNRKPSLTSSRDTLLQEQIEVNIYKNKRNENSTYRGKRFYRNSVN